MCVCLCSFAGPAEGHQWRHNSKRRPYQDAGGGPAPGQGDGAEELQPPEGSSREGKRGGAET